MNLIWMIYFCTWTVVKKFLLYARRSEIRGVDIDNPYLNVIMALTVPDIDDVTAVDYDAIDERIYWADVKTRTIKRAFINGTKLETVMSGGMLQSIFPVTFFTQFISLLIFLLLLIKLNVSLQRKPIKLYLILPYCCHFVCNDSACFISMNQYVVLYYLFPLPFFFFNYKR